MRWLGLDIGSARIGVALGDDETSLASPWKVISVASHDQAVEEVRVCAQTEGAQGLVIGFPRPLHDQSRVTAQEEEIESWVDELAQLGLTIERENETLSSAQAAAWQRDRGQKGKRDDLAACAILQTFLDRRRVNAHR